MTHTNAALVAIAFALLAPSLSPAQRFYPDDPILEMPPPTHVEDAYVRRLNDAYDLITNTLRKPGERQPKAKRADAELIPAQGVNTLGEVPNDPAWFVNRIGSRPMSIEEVVRGPGDANPPADGKWTIIGAKQSGVTPGLRIRDSGGRVYMLKFDPKKYPEIATASDVMGAKFFHALGYNVPENYLVEFDLDRLELGQQVLLWDPKRVKERPMTQKDVRLMAQQVARRSDGRIRAVASRFIDAKPIGEFRYYGVRKDDHNDITPHEHRRDLRGLFVFAAWLNHNDSRAINNLDGLATVDGVQFVKHYLIDFGAMFGSASVTSNSARDGNAYFWEFGTALKQLFTAGIYTPGWMRDSYVKRRSLGMIEYPGFEPEKWKPNYPNAAFLNRLPDDEFWAAKKVMAFTDEHIEAIVREARYSRGEDERLLTQYLIDRRDAIGRTYFAKVLPLDDFRVEDGRLSFEDLGAKHGFSKPRAHQVAWSRFDNVSGEHIPIEGATSVELPGDAPDGTYFAARITGESERKAATAYVLKYATGYRVVGLERSW